MLFNSYIFLFLFLPLCLFGYFFCNKRGWNKSALLILIGMSLWFYSYNHLQYLLLFVFSILCNWLIVQIMNKKPIKYPQLVLGIGIGINILIIFYYKYLYFVVFNMNRFLNTSFTVEAILLPLGISFYTFQQISFLVDTIRGETKEYTFLEYVAFISFFPQLVAGPICLHSEIIPQFRKNEKRCFNYDNFAAGIYIFATGLFKKVILADTFGEAVSWGFSNTDILSSLEIAIVMLSYTFQIYFDFSGYSDMAIGIARMFNIDIPHNFNSPYKANSIIEFWDKWHMTLTRFLRKYVYFPMGGSKKGKIRTYVNILTVFLISGIWHGANWTFILWGCIHGIANILNRIFKKEWDKLHTAFQWICTFSFINVTWLLFRADSVSQAIELLKRLIRAESFEIHSTLNWCFYLNEFDICQWVVPFVYDIRGFWIWISVAMGLFVCLNMTDVADKEFKPTWIKMLGTAGMLIWSVVSFGGITTFLYFNF
ncbi:MAG: MBOAT family protein [Lachnospiraceae bacterium]|nr:MBOAT family protein [Lachnospiraceae bacterium]